MNTTKSSSPHVVKQTHYMRVTKRDGSLEDVKFDEISERLKSLTRDLDIDPIRVATLVCSRLTDKIKTSELDDMSADLCSSLVVENMDFEVLGVRILRSNHDKETRVLYSEVADQLQENRDEDGQPCPILSDAFYRFICTHRETVDKVFLECTTRHDLFGMSIFGWKTLYRSYLLKSNRRVVERPEHLFFRIALFLYEDEWGKVESVFSGLLRGWFIHATPTLYHAGTQRPQMSSCFLTTTEDSIEEIFQTLSNVAQISKWAGGIGMSITGVRSKNSYIRGTNGHSNGIMPMLKVFNDTSRYIDQGGGKRKGSFACYIEPWHADIFDFLFAKRNVGNEEERARDLFYGLWVPDLFMKRVEENGVWSLMCPNRCRDLLDTYGEDFERVYEAYETKGVFVRQIEARKVWKEIVHSQIETGLPYMLYKDSCNSKSNQKNLGTIRNSNLCCEIVQYSRMDEIAVCNLSSINLASCVTPNTDAIQKLQDCVVYTDPKCVFCILLKLELEENGVRYIEKDAKNYRDMLVSYNLTTVPQLFLSTGEVVGGFEEVYDGYLRPVFDFEKLGRVVGVLVENMNMVINKNYYPTEECRRSNMAHRPIGIGVQGLADLFCRLRLPFDSNPARTLNRKIFETIYFAALSASNRLVETFGRYSSFEGSPLSEGRFHFELCPNFDPSVLTESAPVHDWELLRGRIQRNGVCNSLMVAPMPTASTSQILNQNECIEPFTSNLYVRRTLAGEFTVFNKYLLRDLRALGLWNQDMVDYFVVNKGSVSNFAPLPLFLRKVYRTAWEIPQKSLIDMAAERQWFIDQSQSFNLFVADPSFDKITKMHFYGWKKGLKTGSYYVRTKPQHFSQNFTVDPNKDACTSCSA